MNMNTEIHDPIGIFEIPILGWSQISQTTLMRAGWV